MIPQFAIGWNAVGLFWLGILVWAWLQRSSRGR